MGRGQRHDVQAMVVSRSRENPQRGRQTSNDAAKKMFQQYLDHKGIRETGLQYFKIAELDDYQLGADSVHTELYLFTKDGKVAGWTAGVEVTGYNRQTHSYKQPRATQMYYGDDLDQALEAINDAAEKLEARGFARLKGTNPHRLSDDHVLGVIQQRFSVESERRSEQQRAQMRAEEDANLASLRAADDVRYSSLPAYDPPQIDGMNRERLRYIEFEEIEEGVGRVIIHDWPHYDQATNSLSFPASDDENESLDFRVEDFERHFNMPLSEYLPYAVELEDPAAITGKGLLDFARAFSTSARQL